MKRSLLCRYLHNRHFHVIIVLSIDVVFSSLDKFMHMDLDKYVSLLRALFSFYLFRFAKRNAKTHAPWLVPKVQRFVSIGRISFNKLDDAAL